MFADKRLLEKWDAPVIKQVPVNGTTEIQNVHLGHVLIERLLEPIQLPIISQDTLAKEWPYQLVFGRIFLQAFTILYDTPNARFFLQHSVEIPG
ncbi:hypothetical protein [Candidatus Phyllobacterium onerii]|uniref:hypothetical protein n=1 Tax=Candidatus Phyllobacterium onerii TaxID=3020828 RepID=UPI00232F63F6|nr:hypothetical protein [Phyllobacterium sp. IY22]